MSRDVLAIKSGGRVVALATLRPDDMKRGQVALYDLDAIPFHMRGDYATRNKNVEAGNPLCTHCDGTGNELFSMYRECPVCKGSGTDGEHVCTERQADCPQWFK